MIAAIAFYVFAFILLFCAARVVTSRNPVHSVLYLILAFFNASALFVLAGAVAGRNSRGDDSGEPRFGAAVQ